MLRLSVTHAKPGMVLAQQVDHPQRLDTILLRPGVALDRFNIPRLVEMGVRDIWIKYPGLEEVVKYTDPRTLAAHRQIIERVGAAMDAALSGAEAQIEYHSYRDAVMSLLDRLADNPASAALIGDMGAVGSAMARHAGNTCFLSLLMGIKLDYYLIQERTRMTAGTAKDVAALGVGAMFHDYGLTRIDPEELAAWARTRDEDHPTWKRHPQLGYDAVKDHLNAAAAGVVLHHHQRFDGTGFPRRIDVRGNSVPLAGSEIHVFARIAACAEMYDRVKFGTFLPTDQDSQPIPAVKALGILRRPPYVSWIDPVVLRTLHQVVPAYPPGTLVKISGGHTAAVLDWRPNDPCRPEVQLVQHPAQRTRRAIEPVRIDLRRETGVRIESVDGIETIGDNFTLSDIGLKSAA
ncbi:MAG: HD domain-containing protein [Planctomycetes bacterium]|nr:HD domain-containing protein [Planctomycetota bacterium]